MSKQVILASTSPRRRQALGMMNIKFKIVDSGYEEIVKPKMPHGKMVKFLALGKAKAAAKKYPKAIIIAADTMVSFNGKILGKPKNAAEAKTMLKSFRGKSQDVLSGVVVMDSESGKIISKTIKSKIYFRSLSKREIDAYIKTGEPFDKAGAYSPQGRGFNLIEKIQGSFTNTLGLPMDFVYNALEQLGIKI